MNEEDNKYTSKKKYILNPNTKKHACIDTTIIKVSYKVHQKKSILQSYTLNPRQKMKKIKLLPRRTLYRYIVTLTLTLTLTH